jgi:hypothetical protein
MSESGIQDGSNLRVYSEVVSRQYEAVFSVNEEKEVF